MSALKDCTDIVISHYHGDHIPLANANPYQLSAQKVASCFRKPRLWCKNLHDASSTMEKRCQDLAEVLGRKLPPAEGHTDSLFSFSSSMPHGERNNHLGMVMMTRVEDNDEVFVHASDIQLLDDEPITQILGWKPDTVLASGPPLYLRYLSSKKRKKAWENALCLAQEVPTLILDHHLLRSDEGYRFLNDLSSSTGHKIFCAADHMGVRPLLLEAWRQRLYREMPVPEGWHKDYARGLVTTDQYKRWRGWNVS